MSENVVVFGVGGSYPLQGTPFWGERGRGPGAVKWMRPGDALSITPVADDQKLRVESEVLMVFGPGARDNTMATSLQGFFIGHDLTRDSTSVPFNPPANGGLVVEGLPKVDPVLVGRRISIPAGHIWGKSGLPIQTSVQSGGELRVVQDYPFGFSPVQWPPSLDIPALLQKMIDAGTFEGTENLTVVIATGNPPYVGGKDPYVRSGDSILSLVGDQRLQFEISTGIEQGAEPLMV